MAGEGGDGLVTPMKSTKGLLAALLALLLLTAGCAPRQVDQLERNQNRAQGVSTSREEGEDSQEEEPPAEEEGEEEEEESVSQAPALTTQEAEDLLAQTSVARMEDFASPQEIQPDNFVTFFVMANYQGADKMPIPEGFRQVDGSLLIPGEELEDFVLEYFDVTADTLRSGSMYQEATQSYLLGGIGNPAPSLAKVTELREEGDQTVIVFDNYLDYSETEQSDLGVVGPVSTRELTVSFVEDGVRFQALVTTFQADMNQLLQ